MSGTAFGSTQRGQTLVIFRMFNTLYACPSDDTSTCSSFDVKGVVKPKSKKYTKTRSRSPYYTCSSSVQRSSSQSLSPGKSNYLVYDFVHKINYNLEAEKPERRLLTTSKLSGCHSMMI